jgi:hypothetical protein
VTWLYLLLGVAIFGLLFLLSGEVKRWEKRN